MRSLHLCTTGLIAVLLVSATGCQQQQGATAPPPASESQQAASNALGTLKKLVTEQNYKLLGFSSVDEVKGAALAEPLKQYNIGLDKLKNFQPGQDANTLLTPSSEMIYPVTVGGQVRSSVSIVKKETGYTAASFGNAAIVRNLALYRGSNNPGSFAVRIPVFGMYFLGSHNENRLILTPAFEDSRIPFRVGEPVPAEEVLKVVVPLAQAYNGLPM